LQLQEFGSTYESEVLRNKKKLELADVLIFVYDSSDTNSFSYISNLRVRLSFPHIVLRDTDSDRSRALQQQYKLDDIPSLFVATKSDLDLAQQVSRTPSLTPGRGRKDSRLMVYCLTAPRGSTRYVLSETSDSSSRFSQC